MTTLRRCDVDQRESRQRDLLDDERLCSAVPFLRGAQGREPTHRLCSFLCNRGSYLVRRQDRPVRARRIGEVTNLGSYERASTPRQRGLLDGEQCCAAGRSLRDVHFRPGRGRLICRVIGSRGPYLARRQSRPIRARRIGVEVRLPESGQIRYGCESRWR